MTSAKVIAGMYVSAQENSTSKRKRLPVSYLSHFDVDTYIQDHRSHIETLRIAALPLYGASLVVPHGSGCLDTAAGARRKRWKEWTVAVR